MYNTHNFYPTWNHSIEKIVICIHFTQTPSCLFHLPKRASSFKMPSATSLLFSTLKNKYHKVRRQRTSFVYGQTSKLICCCAFYSRWCNAIHAHQATRTPHRPVKNGSSSNNSQSAWPNTKHLDLWDCVVTVLCKNRLRALLLNRKTQTHRKHSHLDSLSVSQSVRCIWPHFLAFQFSNSVSVRYSSLCECTHKRRFEFFFFI